MAPSLDIILVNRNSGRHLRECLASIAQSNKSDIELQRVVVVDDESSDESLPGIEQFGLPLQVIRNRTRSGYGRSCNCGAVESHADYLLFLNTDTRLLPESLTVPVCFMEQTDNDKVGIVGIQLLAVSGEVTRCSVRLPTFGLFAVMSFGLDRLFPFFFLSHQMKEWDHLSTREVDQVLGAFLMTRRALFERLGGFDERFFVYWEDADFSLRMRDLGYKSIHLSATSAVHEGGGTANRVRAESLFLSLRSRVQYGFKHFGRFRGCLLLAMSATLELISRLAFAAGRGSILEMRETVRAYAKLWRTLPTFLVNNRSS
ncbi:MAG: glycosyltransferase family 2 protein [Candidatus Acidiferrales bacterium]